MAYQKVYNRINWENEPSTNTPINDTNLNKIDYSVNEIDNRIIELETVKLSKTDAAVLIKSVSLDEDTGIFTITYYNGATTTIDTKLEKIAVNFSLDYSGQRLVIKLDDGTVQYADLAAFVSQYEFNDSGTIGFSVGTTGEVSAEVLDGSIQSKHLRPDYLADITVQAESAKQSATEAAVAAASALASQEQVSADKAEIATTVTESLNEASEEILTSLKDYFERAEALYNSMYLNCDGETPTLRAITPIVIDGGNPAQRAVDGGILFDGGTPISRQAAS